MAGKRTWGPFDPKSTEPYAVSRSKLEIFSECPRCSYLDLRLGVKRPSSPPFTLNTAVDELLKREFDVHRANKEPHPFMKAYGIDAIPFAHEDLDKWRHNFTGIRYLHPQTNLLVFGAIDDVWATPEGELIIVDYKATAKKIAPASEEDLYDSYKRQMEIYQWLFRQNGFKVSSTGYFVYVNGKSDAKAFDGKLEFDVNLIPYAGSDAWVEGTIIDLKKMLVSDEMPPSGTGFGGVPCEFCAYRDNAKEAGKRFLEIRKSGKKK